MNELSISELETVSAGEMTREERQKVLAPKDGDGIVTTVGKAILRKVVNGLDTISDLVEPVTGKYTGQDARNAAKNILEKLCNLGNMHFRKNLNLNKIRRLAADEPVNDQLFRNIDLIGKAIDLGRKVTVDYNYIVVLFCIVIAYFWRTVGASVIHKNDLCVDISLIQDAIYAFIQVFFAIINRYYYCNDFV